MREIQIGRSPLDNFVFAQLHNCTFCPRGGISAASRPAAGRARAGARRSQTPPPTDFKKVPTNPKNVPTDLKNLTEDLEMSARVLQKVWEGFAGSLGEFHQKSGRVSPEVWEGFSGSLGDFSRSLGGFFRKSGRLDEICREVSAILRDVYEMCRHVSKILP